MKYLIPLFLLLSCTPMGNHVPPAADQPIVKPVVIGKDGCTDRYWKERGYMPKGAAKGIIESYKRELAKKREPRKLGTASKDALAHYGLGAGNETRKTYAFMFGLCMRESNCNYSLGRDYTAKGPQNSMQAESGMWQFSMDSIGADPELKKVYEYYKANPSLCLVDVYKDGLYPPGHEKCVITKSNPRKSALCISTTGYIDSPKTGAYFQRFFRSCPAAQAEYTAALIRTLRAHFGPINRKEVEYVKACEDLLKANE